MNNTTVIIYGIKNCDTMKKAFNRLEEKGISYQFHDYKKKGISKEKLAEWLKQSDLMDVVNNKGTTYKKLSPEQQEALKSQGSAIPIIMEYTSVIKRPIVEVAGKLLIGLNPNEWAEAGI